MKNFLFGFCLFFVANVFGAGVQILIPIKPLTEQEMKMPVDTGNAQIGNLIIYAGKYQFSKQSPVVFDKVHSDSEIELLVTKKLSFESERQTVTKMWLNGSLIDEKIAKQKKHAILGKLFRLTKIDSNQTNSWKIEVFFIVDQMTDDVKKTSSQPSQNEKQSSKFDIKNKTVICWGDPENIFLSPQQLFVQKTDDFVLPPVLIGAQQAKNLLEDPPTILKFLEKTVATSNKTTKTGKSPVILSLTTSSNQIPKAVTTQQNSGEAQVAPSGPAPKK